MDKSKKLACYAYECEGDWTKIALMIKEDIDIQEIEIKENYVTILDEAYPKSLRELQFPPWVLFYSGNLSLTDQPCVSIVGSRESKEYGEKMTLEIAQEIASKYVLVSGLARGIDAIVHQVGIEKGKTIGVLGCGLGVEYPKVNQHLTDIMKKYHLVVSEYPYFTKPQRHYFPWRNRIIAALSRACIVTQAQIRSGTMLTVNEALILSKEVLCVPYPLGIIEGEGCNKLIQEGAQIIVNIKQIFE